MKDKYNDYGFTPPIYDDVYYEGVEQLDSIAKGEAMVRVLCKDPGCKICAERMANKIKGEVKPMEKTEDKFRAFLEGLEMQRVDELMGLQPESLRKVAETMAMTIKGNMIRAFGQGAEYGWYEVEYRIDDFGTEEKKEAEENARELLNQGKLGREGE